MKLSPAQLEDFEKMSITLDKINTARIKINALAAANGFQLKPLSIPDLGVIAHQLEKISFEHQLAEAKEAAAR